MIPNQSFKGLFHHCGIIKKPDIPQNFVVSHTVEFAVHIFRPDVGAYFSKSYNKYVLPLE